MKRLYTRGNKWVQGLSRGPYAVFFGVACGTGVFIADSLLGGELSVGPAIVMALGMFGLEYAFGRYHSAGE